MENGISAVRRHVNRIDGVSRTWFEYENREGILTKILVVEVNFDTDPSSPHWRRNVLDAIESTARDILTNETTQIVSSLRIVPIMSDSIP